MTVLVDIWLRGQDFATTRSIDAIAREASDWTDDDVRAVLEGMLRVMHELKYPDDQERAITLRGLSWIVNPFEEGGVVIAIEISLGAAIAGPIQIDKKALETMIARVLKGTVAPASGTVH
jgi:hypothetical protein